MTRRRSAGSGASPPDAVPPAPSADEAGPPDRAGAAEAPSTQGGDETEAPSESPGYASLDVLGGIDRRR